MFEHRHRGTARNLRVSGSAHEERKPQKRKREKTSTHGTTHSTSYLLALQLLPRPTPHRGEPCRALLWLSNREREIFDLVVRGHSNASISEELSISVKTVETHRAKLMEKLDIHSVAELTKYAVREGLTSLYT